MAKLNNDFESSIKACNQVVDLTSYSFKKDYRHLLNHIRNIIDIVDLEDDHKKSVNLINTLYTYYSNLNVIAHPLPT